MEENANTYTDTDEYPSPVISDGQSCVSAACPLDATVNHIRPNCLSIFFSAGTALCAVAWSPVNCACVLQLFQQLINTTLCPAFLGKLVCQPLCCVPLQIQTFYQNLLLVAEYHVDC